MNYEIIRSRRKTMTLEVRRDGSVVVRAPMRVSREQIDTFAASHEQWLQSAVARRLAYNTSHPEPDAAERVALIERAKSELPQRVAFWSERTGLVPTGIRITAARTRFGSCSGKNALSFSWYLMRYPDAAIDYVVLHEIAHIRFHNQSPAFYALIERYMPDWRERMRLLKE